MVKRGARRVIRVAPSSLAALLAVAAAGALVTHDALAAPPSADTRLVAYTKPAIVKVQTLAECYFANAANKTFHEGVVATGSGFFFDPSGYVLTNAHVVSGFHSDDEALKQCLAMIAQENGQPAIAELEKLGFQPVKITRQGVVELQTGKSYPFEIKAYGTPFGTSGGTLTGKDVAVIKIEVTNAPTLKLGDSTTVHEQDRVWVTGFPAAAEHEEFSKAAEFDPTTTDGKISRIVSGASGVPFFQTNAATTHGNSGGPAYNAKGEVIGLLTFGPGTDEQGFNFLVPVNTAQEFVRPSGGVNETSIIDPIWRTGLDAYWSERYSDADKSFGQLLSLFPEHAEAKALKEEDAQHIARGEDKSGRGAMIAIVAGVGVGGLLVLGGLGLAVFFLLRKKPGAPAPGAVAATGGMPAYGAQAYGAQPAPPGYGSAQMPVAQAPGPSYRPPAYSQSSHPPPPGPQHVINPTGAMSQPQPLGIAYAPTAYQVLPNLSAEAAARKPVPRTEAFVATEQGSLLCVSGPLHGQQFAVGNGVMLGRDDSAAQIVVVDPQVSSRHVWVGPVNGKTVARDNGSTNGTYVNGNTDRIREVELKDRDMLTLGGKGTVRFMFRSTS